MFLKNGKQLHLAVVKNINKQTAHTAQYQNANNLITTMGRRPKQTFLQRRHTDGPRHVKRCPTPLLEKNSQNYYEAPPHTCQNGEHRKVYGNAGEKGILLYCWWELLQIGTMENSREVPQKTKNKVTTWMSNPTPGHIARQNYNSKRYVHSSVHSNTIHNS